MGWTNSDYAYAYHIAGSCQTPEEAHRVLSECLNVRKMALREAGLGRRRREIECAVLRRKIESCQDDLERTILRLDLEKLSLHEEIEDADYKYAAHEVEVIEDILTRLEPHCNWVRLGLTREEGYQLAVREERRMLLLERARIGLLSQGIVDTETLREMRSHPDAAMLESAVVSMVEASRNGALRLADRKPLLMLEERNGSKEIR